MRTDEERKAEFKKYDLAYGLKKYRMKPARLTDATHDLQQLPVRGAYLDVSCGYGDVLRAARRLGFSPVRGTEIVRKLIDGKRVVYAEAHKLPFEDKSFSVASMFDTIEHLLPGDDALACKELNRVARNYVLLSSNNKPSVHNGMDLHINKRSDDEWERLFSLWFYGRVVKLSDRRDVGAHASAWWRIELQ